MHFKLKRNKGVNFVPRAKVQSNHKAFPCVSLSSPKLNYLLDKDRTLRKSNNGFYNCIRRHKTIKELKTIIDENVNPALSSSWHFRKQSFTSESSKSIF